MDENTQSTRARQPDQSAPIETVSPVSLPARQASHGQRLEHAITARQRWARAKGYGVHVHSIGGTDALGPRLFHGPYDVRERKARLDLRRHEVGP
jgi:hypothetical protein